MRINRRRSSNIMIIALISIAIGIVIGIFAGGISGVELRHDFYFNWSNALIAFAPLLAAGMLLFGLAQLASFWEEIEAQKSDEQEDYEEE